MEKVPGLKDLTFLPKRNKTHLPLAKMQASHTGFWDSRTRSNYFQQEDQDKFCGEGKDLHPFLLVKFWKNGQTVGMKRKT